MSGKISWSRKPGYAQRGLEWLRYSRGAVPMKKPLETVIEMGVSITGDTQNGWFIYKGKSQDR